jgi:hypothetical protein
MASEVMQPTSQFYRQIRVIFLRVPEHVFDHAASLDARDHMLDHDANAGDEPIVGFVVGRQLPTAGFFLGLVDRHAGHRVALKATVAVEYAAVWSAHPVFIAELLVVLLAFGCVTQVFDLPIL